MPSEESKEGGVLSGLTAENFLGAALSIGITGTLLSGSHIGTCGVPRNNVQIELRDHDIQAFGMECRNRLLDFPHRYMTQSPVSLNTDTVNPDAPRLEAADES